MVPYSTFNKPRRLFETFFLIKTGEAKTKKDLANIFEITERAAHNYVQELNSEFYTDIHIQGGTDKYVILKEGLLGQLKRNYPLTSDDVMLIISSLMQSQAFMETKMSIIKNSLLGLLPEEEGKKLKDMLYFEKTKDYDDQNIEFNITKIRKAITEEKKISFNYRNAKGEYKTHKITPYSFACELGKYYIIGKPENMEILTHLRIDRMIGVTILEESGKREEKFNVYNYLKKTWYMYGGTETKVVVRFENKCKPVVTERNMAEGRILEEDENFFKYEFICNGTKGIKLWLMGFGAEAEVLEPVKLREEIREDVKKISDIYLT